MSASVFFFFLFFDTFIFIFNFYYVFDEINDAKLYYESIGECCENE